MKSRSPARRSMLLALAVLVPAAAFASPVLACENHLHQPMFTSAAAEVMDAAAVRDALRGLWIGHSFQVRNVVMATVGGNTAAAEASETAAVANAQALASAIEPFYGTKAKDQLFQLLAGHYGGIKSYLLAAVAKDKAAEGKAIDAITANAEEIAAFLSTANPNLPKDDVLGLLQAHAGHHITQIQQLLDKDYAGELLTWVDMTNHMYVIADALAGAIAKQFPEKIKA